MNAHLKQFKKESYEDWTKNHVFMNGQRYVDFRICELYNMFLHLRLIIWTQFLPTLGSEFGSKFVSWQFFFYYVGKPYLKTNRKSPYKGPLYIPTILHAFEDREHGSSKKDKTLVKRFSLESLGQVDDVRSLFQSFITTMCLWRHVEWMLRGWM